MTETDPSAVLALAALGRLEGDATGQDTFARYVWQAKQAVRLWLTCLEGAARYVVCERVEDIAVVGVDGFRFLQLKTRDRGSWSAAAMCDKGIKSLVRSYVACRQVQLHERATFELWLEGPAADAQETKDFVEDPTAASRAIRDKVIACGLRKSWIQDFLQRLVICDGQPSRVYIDPQVLFELGRLWPALSRPELEQLYERLLLTATAAQEAAPRPAMIERHLAALTAGRRSSVVGSGDDSGDAVVLKDLGRQVLSHAVLAAVTPPLPDEPIADLLTRLGAGGSASWLELKLRRAGASAETIRRAQAWRADMEVERQLLLASRETADVELEQLACRLLSMAESTARKIAFASASAPAAAARPAEAISDDLLSRPADLAHCDRTSLFRKDEQLIYGYLGHLSDICRFAWRAE